MKATFFLILFATQAVFGSLTGPDDSYYLVHDFSEEWHIMNKQTEQFIPHLNEGQANRLAHTLFIDKKLNDQYYLLIHSNSSGNYIFFNGLFSREIKVNEWLEIPVSSLPSKEGEVILTVFGTSIINQVRVNIGSKINFKNELSVFPIQRGNLLTMKVRPDDPFANNFVFIFCLLFLYTTILHRNNPKAFHEYFSLSSILVFKIRDTKFLISRPLNRVNIAFIVLLSISGAALYLLFINKGVVLFGNVIHINNNGSSLFFYFTFLKSSLLCFAVYFGKFFFLQIAGKLFGIGKSVYIHYYKTIQFTLFFFLLLAVLFYLFGLMPISAGANYSNLLFWAACFFYVTRISLTYISILKSIGIQSVYLFAYLCIVEILPAFIGIRLAF